VDIGLRENVAFGGCDRLAVGRVTVHARARRRLGKQLLVDQFLENSTSHRRDRFLRHWRQPTEQLLIFLERDLELVALYDQLVGVLGGATSGKPGGERQRQTAPRVRPIAPP
jgi:hypothetical protein